MAALAAQANPRSRPEVSLFVFPKSFCLARTEMTDQEFADYWTFLVEKEHRSTYAGLSRDERVFYALNFFRGSVPRSGLIAYFENTECVVIQNAHHALSHLGLTDALKLLQDAQRIILKGDPLPETDQCVTLFDYDLPEEELDKAMNDLGESVRDVQDSLYRQDQAIFDALCRFADENGLRVPKGLTRR